MPACQHACRRADPGVDAGSSEGACCGFRPTWAAPHLAEVAAEGAPGRTPCCAATGRPSRPTLPTGHTANFAARLSAPHRHSMLAGCGANGYPRHGGAAHATAVHADSDRRVVPGAGCGAGGAGHTTATYGDSDRRVGPGASRVSQCTGHRQTGTLDPGGVGSATRAPTRKRTICRTAVYLNWSCDPPILGFFGGAAKANCKRW
mmetsp:Transcript_102726/g.331474  ORF Transcript_102726/g.331474 Transcript_102726/m.331474 type:complete len:204 (-) Transcript_102726:895-1506(-)